MPTRCTSTSTSSGPRRRLGDLADLDVGGTVGRDDLDGAHGGRTLAVAASLSRSAVLDDRAFISKCMGSV